MARSPARTKVRKSASPPVPKAPPPQEQPAAPVSPAPADAVRAREYLTKVLAAAQQNPGLDDCLDYFVCAKGSRPTEMTADELAVVRRVKTVLAGNSRLRADFCRLLAAG